MEVKGACCTVEEADEFKKPFKYYKSRKPRPDLSNVVDFDQPENYKNYVIPYELDVSKRVPTCLLNDVQSWKAYTLQDRPGFTFIRNPFTSDGERYWVRRCLEDFPLKPNRTNLDISEHYQQSDGDIFTCSFRYPDQKKVLLDKLRWATYGYLHNWSTRVYTEDNQSVMPDDLYSLSCYIAHTVGYKEYRAEAGIINYYPVGMSMGGHVDYSELDHISPIVSISFGCSAVFLLGGPTKATPPTALFIRSGDVVMMSSSCRLSYHAVPAILPRSCRLGLSVAPLAPCSCHEPCRASPPSVPSQTPHTDPDHSAPNNLYSESHDSHDDDDDDDDNDNDDADNVVSLNDECNDDDDDDEIKRWKFINQYILNNRINMNVRQVFPNA